MPVKMRQEQMQKWEANLEEKKRSPQNQKQKSSKTPCNHKGKVCETHKLNAAVRKAKQHLMRGPHFKPGGA